MSIALGWIQSRAIDIYGIPQCEAVDRIGVLKYEAIDVYGVPNSEAIEAKYVPSLAPSFELQMHFSGCFKSRMNFFDIFQYSGGLNASHIESF